MRYGFLALLILLSACTESGTSDNEQTFSLEGFTSTDIPDTDASWVQRKSANGFLLEEGIISNGRRDGTWVMYHDSEKQIPSSISTYRNGQLTGPHSEYTALGGLLLVRHYLNNQLHGQSVEYRNGRLVKVANYSFGKKNGKQQTFYERSDQVQTEAEFRDGVQHGVYRYYAEDGSVVMEYQYENGEKVRGGPVE